MAISEEVTQIISILEEEGFGALAGELMTEISLGRPIEKILDIFDPSDKADDRDTVISRVPIEESEQLFEATAFLRNRLVLPILAFGEAEKIANDIAGQGAIKIRFIDPDEKIETEPISRLEAGDDSIAIKLDDFLGRLTSMTQPPKTRGE